MKVRMFEFDGTTEDMNGLDPAIWGGTRSAEIAPCASKHFEPTQVEQTGVEAGEDQLTPRIVVRALTRRHLMSNPRGVLQALLQAGDSGMSATELAAAIKITRPQLAGVLGALGRRIANTEGWPKEAQLFDYEWEESERQWRYRLKSVVREVIVSGQVTL